MPCPRAASRPYSYDATGRLFAYHSEKQILVRDLVGDRDLCHLEGIVVENPWKTGWPSLSADGCRVLLSVADGHACSVRWFDSKTGKELGRYSLPESEMHPGQYKAVEWYAADGTVFGYVAKDSRLTLVDCHRKRICRSLGMAEAFPGNDADGRTPSPPWTYQGVGHGASVLALRRNDQGQPTAFTVWDRGGNGWSRRFELKPKVMEDAYWPRILSPDGRCMSVHSHYVRNNEVGIFETATGRLRGIIRAPAAISPIDFSPDGKTLATSCEDTSVLLWDLNRPLDGKPDLPLPTNAVDAEKLWHALGDHDPRAMEPALWALVHAPEQALPILKKHLQPVRRPERLLTLVKRLDSASFQERTAATAELLKNDDFAGPVLRAVLDEGATSLEQKRRIEELLARLENFVSIPSCLRELRAIEVLERIGSRDARQIIETLATGDAEALVTREARIVLGRWRK